VKEGGTNEGVLQVAWGEPPRGCHRPCAKKGGGGVGRAGMSRGAAAQAVEKQDMDRYVVTATLVVVVSAAVLQKPTAGMYRQPPSGGRTTEQKRLEYRSKRYRRCPRNSVKGR